MCGRFALGIPIRRFIEFFTISGVEEREAFFKYNVAPSQEIPGIVRDPATGGRESDWFRWGLVPSWAADPKPGARMINARAETIREKPAFRDAFRSRRCLLPAQGFYEWDHRERTRIPWFFHRRNGDPLAFAGLWEHRKSGEGGLTTCAIITTAANDAVTPLHDRMPVILDPGAWDAWLDPAETPSALASLLVPASSGTLDRYRVSRAVNNVRTDGPGCIAPLHGESGDLFHASAGTG